MHSEKQKKYIKKVTKEVNRDLPNVEINIFKDKIIISGENEFNQPWKQKISIPTEGELIKYPRLLK